MLDEQLMMNRKISIIDDGTEHNPTIMDQMLLYFIQASREKNKNSSLKYLINKSIIIEDR